MIHRVLVSLPSLEFHANAKKHAKVAHGTDLSGLVAKLIIDDIRRELELRVAEQQTEQHKLPKNSRTSGDRPTTFV